MRNTIIANLLLSMAAGSLAAALSATSASAQVQSLTGSISGLGIAGPDASCAPLPFRGSLTGGTGSSNLGAFTYSHQICLSGASGPLAGSYLADFGTATFFGALTGTASPTATPGIATLDLTYSILGGTGAFDGASGFFSGIATTDARTRPTIFTLNFDGSLLAPSVPEPGSWVLLLLGFAGMGVRLRRERDKLKSRPATV